MIHLSTGYPKGVHMITPNGGGSLNERRAPLHARIPNRHGRKDDKTTGDKRQTTFPAQHQRTHKSTPTLLTGNPKREWEEKEREQRTPPKRHSNPRLNTWRLTRGPKQEKEGRKRDDTIRVKVQLTNINDVPDDGNTQRDGGGSKTYL